MIVVLKRSTETIEKFRQALRPFGILTVSVNSNDSKFTTTHALRMRTLIIVNL
jgi:hypothetical protein